MFIDRPENGSTKRNYNALLLDKFIDRPENVNTKWNYYALLLDKLKAEIAEKHTFSECI